LVNENIEILKKLISEGYQIASKEIGMVNLDKSTSEAVLTVTIKLAKGNDVKEIISKNDSEFLGFTEHFIKKRDQFDNYVFEYAESVNKTHPIDEIPKTMIDQHIIEIGSRKFEQGIWMRYISPPQPNIPQVAEFFLFEEKNPNLKNIDFKDWVKIYDKSTGKAIFGGFVRDAEPHNNDLFFHCIGSDKYIQYSKVTFQFLNMSASESLYFTSKLIELHTNYDEAILKKINFNKRKFSIVMPVMNIVLQEDVKIADAVIYHELNSPDDNFIRKSSTGRNDSDWNGNNLRIKTEIEATDYHTAVKKGYQKISRIMDWLSFRSDFSFTSYGIKQSTKVPFSVYRHFSRIKVPPKIYCRDTTSNGHLFLDLRSIVENLLVLDRFAGDYFKHTKDMFEYLISKEPESLSKEESSLLESCHWLRLSLFSSDKTERLIFLSASLEFVMTEIIPTKIFTPEKIDEINNIFKNIDLDEKQKALIKLLNTFF